MFIMFTVTAHYTSHMQSDASYDMIKCQMNSTISFFSFIPTFALGVTADKQLWMKSFLGGVQIFLESPLNLADNIQLEMHKS